MGMIDISEKEVTLRKAQASGRILLPVDAYESARNKNNPKGDVLIYAEVAGINGAKACSALLPLCHPLPLEEIQISFKFDDDKNAIEAICQVSTHSKTGVEMEALTGVQAALLCIYDMSKVINPEIKIGETALNWKLGGKKGLWVHPSYKGEIPKQKPSYTPDLSGKMAAVITLSDRASSGDYEDTSGPAIVEIIESMNGHCNPPIVIPDDPQKLKEAIGSIIEGKKPNLIVTTGGTGVSPRDITPETLRGLFDREVPGIGELLRSHGSRYTELSWASRSVGGMIGKTLIIALPGRENAVREGFEALSVLLPHLLKVAEERS